MSKIDSLHQMFVDELSDVHDAERQFTQAMQSMLAGAQHPQVKQALQQHIEETQRQISNLQQVFDSLGMPPQQKTCKGAAGIVSEYQSMTREVQEPKLLDGLIVGSASKGEHYEIATYRCLVEKARLMKHAEAERLLTENLRMEERFATQLEEMDRVLGQQLVQQSPEVVGHQIPR